MKKIEDIYPDFHKIKDGTKLITCLNKVREDIITRCKTYEFTKFHEIKVDKKFNSYRPVLAIFGKDNLSVADILTRYYPELREKDKNELKKSNSEIYIMIITVDGADIVFKSSCCDLLFIDAYLLKNKRLITNVSIELDNFRLFNVANKVIMVINNYETVFFEPLLKFKHHREKVTFVQRIPSKIDANVERIIKENNCTIQNMDKDEELDILKINKVNYYQSEINRFEQICNFLYVNILNLT